jgi:acyl dehydratase
MTTLDEIERFEVYFETLEIGQRFVSPRRTVTEADVVNFAGLSGDYNGLHTDAVLAAETQHCERIAHGLLVLAITSGLSTRLPAMRGMERTLIGLKNLQVQWKAPTKIGARSTSSPRSSRNRQAPSPTAARSSCGAPRATKGARTSWSATGALSSNAPADRGQRRAPRDRSDTLHTIQAIAAPLDESPALRAKRSNPTFHDACLSGK